MFSASGAEITASIGTSANSAIFSRMSLSSGCLERHTMMSGAIPMRRSSCTECWVGLVFSSPATSMYGTSVQWMYMTLSRPIWLRNWRIASRNGRLSMSPTVPPISVMTTSTSPELATRWMRDLISSVTCGITCTVEPRYSPLRSLRMMAL